MKQKGVRLKYIGDIFRGDSPNYVPEGIPVINQACIQAGEVDWSRVKYSDPETADKIRGWLHHDDVLINSTGTGTLGRVAHYRGQDNLGFVDGHVTILRLENVDFLPRFIYYTLSIAQERITLECAEGSTNQIELSRAKFGDYRIPRLPIQQQEAIADFLDHELQRLDQLAAARQHQLALLEEKRRALIAQAVTQGLDAQAPRRDSGFAWLGQVPAHWEVVRLKFLGSIHYGLSQPPDYLTSGIPFIRATNVTRGKITEEGLVYVSEEIRNNERTFILETGDIVVVRSGAYTGDSALITEKWNDAVAGFDMVFRCYSKMEPAFVSYSLLMPHVLDAQIDALRMRAAQPHLNAEELGSVLMPVPPKEEQRSICAMIDESDKILSELRAKIEHSLILIQQKRSSLITAAVTGQLTIT